MDEEAQALSLETRILTAIGGSAMALTGLMYGVTALQWLLVTALDNIIGWGAMGVGVGAFFLGAAVFRGRAWAAIAGTAYCVFMALSCVGCNGIMAFSAAAGGYAVLTPLSMITGMVTLAAACTVPFAIVPSIRLSRYRAALLDI